MIVIGIDPGLERMGYGVVRREGSKLTAVAWGLLETPRIATCDRVQLLFEGLCRIMDKEQPTAFAIEKLFFTNNQTTAMDVARASGVALLAAAQRGLEVHEYSPPQIKKGVVGHGSADKKQVQYMVTRILSLKETPKPDDVADALAIAITHALHAPPTKS
jgi:crossover junction endodeoxyribonuclease RuvC